MRKDDDKLWDQLALQHMHLVASATSSSVIRETVVVRRHLADIDQRRQDDPRPPLPR